MKKIIILLITIVVASIAMGVVAGCKFDGGESTHEHKYADAYTCHDRTCTVEGCGHVEKATTAHKFADEFTCHDRTCKDCGSVEKATTKHKFADEFTCHDRTCMNCGSVEKATTEHSWGEWVTVREPSCTEKGVQTRECDNCGDTETADLPAKGHTYADEFTCHDRVCTVEDCGHIEKATTAHNFGDWEIVKEPTCTEEGLKERICSVCGDKESEKIATEHSFGEDGVCTNCHKDVKEFLIASQTVAATVTANAKAGKYSISSTASDGVYAIIHGDILTELKKLGYTALSVIAKNPALGLADDSSKVKPIYVAADDTANLWSEGTAIAYYGWKEFWDAGKSVQFSIDLNEYAGRDIYIYTEHADVYPLEIMISEFGYEDKSGWLVGNNAYWGSVEYIEGKGWIMKDTTDGGAQGQFWSIIPKAVIQKKISEGYTKMTIVYANSFEGVDNPNVGDFINTKSMICPIKKSGGNDYDYVSGTIAEYCAEVNKDGVKYYEHHVDLTDANHDFTKDIDVLCYNKDVYEKKVTCGYVADIVFEKGEPVVQEDKSGWMLGSPSDNGAVRYIEGKGWVMSPVSGSGDFWCLISGSVIQKKIAEGYTKMTIVYANNLEGSENKDTGNFVNTTSRLYPCKAGGGYILDYVSGAISSYCIINAAGNYEHTISLTDEKIDFTKDQYVYCVAADNNKKAVTRGYIADIVFSK